MRLLPVTRGRRSVSKVVFVPCGFLWFKADALRNATLSVGKTAWGHEGVVMQNMARFLAVSSHKSICLPCTFVSLHLKMLTGSIPGPWAYQRGVCIFSLCLHALLHSTHEHLKWIWNSKLAIGVSEIDNPGQPYLTPVSGGVRSGREVNVKWGAVLCQPVCQWQMEWGVRATPFWTSAIYRLEG